MTEEERKYAISNLRFRPSLFRWLGVFHFSITFIVLAVLTLIFAVYPFQNNHLDPFLIKIALIFLILGITSMYFQSKNLRFSKFSTQLQPAEIYSRINRLCDKNDWSFHSQNFENQALLPSQFLGGEITTSSNNIHMTSLEIKIIINHSDVLINVLCSPLGQGLSGLGILKWTWNPEKIMKEITGANNE